MKLPTKIYRTLLTTLLSLLTITSFADDITGRVSSNSEPLAGAYVIWAGTAKGTITDYDGAFSLQRISETNKLVASYVGYVSDTITVTASATEIDFTLTPVSLEAVDVSARRLGTTIARKEASLTQNLSADELCKAACCNLGESFQTNASVDVTYSDATTGAKTIQLLGLQGRYVQMLNENTPTLRGLATPYGLSYIPGPWMDAISISKGVGTVVNGYEALTGQINVTYGRAVGAEEIATVNLFGSSSGKIEGNARANIRVGDFVRTVLMVNASKDLVDTDDNNDGLRDEPKVQQLNLFNRWYHHTDFHTLDVVIKTLNEKRIGGQTAHEGKGQQDGIYGVYLNTDRIEAWMKNGFVFSDRVNVGFPINYSYHYQDSYFGQQTYRATQQTYNFNSIANIQVGQDDEIHCGVSSQGDFYRENVDYGQGKEWLRQNDVSVGLYGQYTLRVEELLTVIAGIRLDRHNNYGTLLTPRLHVRMTPHEHTTIRLAIGRGHRPASILAEQNYLLSSSREWVMSDNYDIEQGWNMGGSIAQDIHIGSRHMSVVAEYYRTEFSRVLITDLDADVHQVIAHFSADHAFANNMQIEAHSEIVRGLDLTLAYRRSGSRMYLGGELKSRPLVSRYKGLLALSYQTPLKTWQVDGNLQLNGGGRVPSTTTNPTEYQRPDSFNHYYMLNGQVTKWFRYWSIYAGAENITNFTQSDPIISASNPQSSYFDSNLIWGPLMERKFYVGVRISIRRNDE